MEVGDDVPGTDNPTYPSLRRNQPQPSKGFALILMSPNTRHGMTPRTKEHIHRYNEAICVQEESLANRMKDGMCFEVVYSTYIENMI